MYMMYVLVRARFIGNTREFPDKPDSIRALTQSPRSVFLANPVSQYILSPGYFNRGIVYYIRAESISLVRNILRWHISSRSAR